VVSELIKKVKIQEESNREIWRLSGLLRDDASAIVKRGGSLKTLSSIKGALSALGAVITVSDYLKTPFAPRRGPSLKPFSEGRFGDGKLPVFYAAEDFKTTVSEVKHHHKPKLRPGFPQKLMAFTCHFSGTYALLLGHEIEYPLLTKKSPSSYPFCQLVARELRPKAQGIRTRSARRTSGVCRPVFAEATLSHGLERHMVEFSLMGRRVLTRTI
jgi:RES domain